jgi:HEAT repeat protein
MVEVRYNSALALVAICSLDARAIPVLVEMAGSVDFGDENDDWFMVVSLGILDPGNIKVSARLQSLLFSQSRYIRTKAAEALGLLKAIDAVDALRGRLQDEDQSVRTASAHALGNLGKSAAPSIRDLVILSSRGREDREAALGALECLGEDSLWLISELLKCAALYKFDGDVASLIEQREIEGYPGIARVLDRALGSAAPEQEKLGAVRVLAKLKWQGDELKKAMKIIASGENEELAKVARKALSSGNN